MVELVVSRKGKKETGNDSQGKGFEEETTWALLFIDPLVVDSKSIAVAKSEEVILGTQVEIRRLRKIVERSFPSLP